MKRGTSALIGAVALGLLALALAWAVGRAITTRRAAQVAPTQQGAAAPVLEFAASDIVTASVRELRRELAVSGTVRAVNSAFVKARVAAEITRVAVREGDTVKAGQVLVQQDSTEFDWRLRQAEQQAASARSQLEIAQRTLANNKALVAQGFISPTALDTAINTEVGAQATLQAALAAVELARKARGDATLLAPIGGIVAQRLVQPGERAGIDARLLEIVDLRQLELEAALTPEDVAQLRVGQTARLHVDGIADEITARVARINPSAQAGSRSVMVYLAIQAHAALRHGLFARGSVQLEQRSVLALPAVALRGEAARPYVLALVGNTVQAREVRLGLRGTHGGVEWVEITQGLQDGTRVLGGSVGAVREGSAWRVAAPAAAAPTAMPASGAR
jgi:RND family efflux transporter MFP subunit